MRCQCLPTQTHPINDMQRCWVVRLGGAGRSNRSQDAGDVERLGINITSSFPTSNTHTCHQMQIHRLIVARESSRKHDRTSCPHLGATVLETAYTPGNRSRSTMPCHNVPRSITASTQGNRACVYLAMRFTGHDGQTSESTLSQAARQRDALASQQRPTTPS